MGSRIVLAHELNAASRSTLPNSWSSRSLPSNPFVSIGILVEMNEIPRLVLPHQPNLYLGWWPSEYHFYLDMCSYPEGVTAVRLSALAVPADFVLL